MEQGWEVGVIGAPAANDPLGVIRLGLVVERPSGLIRGFEILEDPDDFQQLMVRAEAAPMAGTVDKPPIVWVATADVGAAVRGTLVGRRATLCVTDELPALARVAAGMEEQSPFSGPLYPPDFPGARDVARLMAVAARLAELRPWETSDESRVLVLDDGAGGVCVTLGGAGTCFGLVLYPDVHTYASVTLDAQAGLSPGPNCNWTALWFDPVDRVPDMARLVMRGLGWTNPDWLPTLCAMSGAGQSELSEPEQAVALTAFEAAAAHLERMDRDAPDALLGVPIQHSLGGQTIQVMLDEAVVGFGEMPLSLVPADDFIVIAGTHEGHPALAIRMKMADARKLHAALQLIRVVRPAGPETVVAEGYDGALSLLPWSTRLPDPMSLVGQTVALVAMGGGTRRVSADRPMAWKRVAGITLLEMAPPLDDRIEDGAPTSDWIHLEVTLYGVPARILHRRFAMRAEATLADLAAALMELGGWEYAHLWEFTKGKNTLASMDDDLDAISLHEVLPRKRSRIGWLYDFGDYWQHSIRRVGHSDPEPGDTAYARLESAVGAFPPEDSGGVCGYEAMADAARAGRFRDDWHREFFPDWHPDRFDEDALRDRFDC